MRAYLKRMFRIGEVTFINSVIPILTWATLGVITHNTRLINVFSLTYSVQFIPYFLLALCVTGNIIGKEKGTATKDHIYSGIVIENIIGLTTIVLVTLNQSNVIRFMGGNGAEGVSNTWVLYSLWLMYLQIPLSQVLELHYFKGEDTQARSTAIAFNLLYFTTINLLYLTTRNELISAILSLTIIAIYIYHKLLQQVEPFKFKFQCFSGIRYRLSTISSNLMMFITYLLGMKIVFEYSPEFALAVSFCGMITDTQWDMIISSITTVSKVEIAKGTAKLKNLFNAARIYASIIVLSIWVLLLMLYTFYKPEINYTVIILLFEAVDMLLLHTKYIKQSYVDIERNTKWSMVLVISAKVIQTLITIAGFSIYSLWVGQLACSILETAGFSYLYNQKRKVKEEIKQWTYAE